MDTYTQNTKFFLEDRFEKNTEGIYWAHQQIYGFRSPYALTTLAKYMVTKSILNSLNKYDFSSFIDVGGAEGYTANLVRKIFEVLVKSTDISENACKMAKSIFDIDALPADIHNLPFDDNSFDAVLSSETIEHVVDFKKAIDELLRITNKILIITVPHETPEMVAETIRKKIPHGHINYFDTTTLDYLKEKGYIVHCEKTLSPFLRIPRVVVEAYKRQGNSPIVKVYNAIVPILNKLFNIKTANKLIDLDSKFANGLVAYRGLTFIIEKTKQPIKENISLIKAKDFTDIKVPPYKITN